ncbi:MAG: PDZ domain-containing protein, partial [Sediminibacterium sp.]
MKFDFTKYIFLFLLLATSQIISAQGTMLLRQPTLSSKHIVFVHADDLWIVDKDGGEARRLTSALGAENNPKLSPDGNWVAFTGQYDGNTDVYLISISGGAPKRLTWHPGADIVQGWTPDGKSIIFTSGREGFPTATTRFYKVNITGGTPEALILPFASAGSLSSEGQAIAYQPYPFWDPEWRNYRGGQAQPIWIFNLSTQETIKTIQGDKERHTAPVWDNGIVYFLSEQDFANNVWSFDPKTKAQKQLTFHKDFDVKNLSASNGLLVYEQGGYLHTYDIATAKNKQLVINATGDLNWSRARWNNIPASGLQNASLSPTGKRVVFEYRGEIFTLPKEYGDYRNISKSTGAADRYPSWSPDGQKIAWFSDVSGEYELMVSDQSGLQTPKAYPIPNKKFYYSSNWSPDGKYIAFTDTDYNLWYIELATGKLKLVATDRLAHPVRTLKPSWSPDSKWIAYVQIMNNEFKAVHVYNLDSEKSTQLTDGLSDVIDPQWDENGKYLYFLASTDYALSIGWLDMSSTNYPVTRALYMAVLNKETSSPFQPKSDEEIMKPGDAEKADAAKDSTKNIKAKPTGVKVKIDFDGIQQRIISVNVPVRNYAGLVAGPEDHIFFYESIPNETGFTLHRYSIKERKSTEFMKNVLSPATSFDRKNILYRNGANWYVVSTVGSAPKPGDGKVNTDNMKVYVDPPKEAEQIFREGWRYQRDFLYVDNVHGAPWDKIYNWYKPWIAHVKHRSDLNYIIDILGGEVSIGHSYTSGGDYPEITTIPGGLLGADYEKKDGYFLFKKIYTGENWNPDLVSPLSGPGINVKEGDYLLEVDGKPLTASMNIYSLFEGTANHQVKIRVNNKPTLEGSKLITVVPVAAEDGLRSRNWVESNRRKVSELSGGKMAYVYVPNTGGSGYTYFNRYYFAQQDKKGAIIDERNNGGGQAADYIIDILSRKL